MRIRPLLINLHLWVALATGVFLLILGVTGAMLVFAPMYERAKHPDLLVVQPGPAWKPLDSLVALARNEGDPAIVIAPRDDDESLQIFYMNEKKRPAVIYLNQYTGAVLGKQTIAVAQQGLMLRVRLFHRTLFWGKKGGQFVGAVTILAVFMALTGLVLWWPRKIVWVKKGASLSRFNFDLHNIVGLFSSALLLILSVTGIIIFYPQVGKLMNNFDGPPVPEPEYQAPATAGAPLSLDSIVKIGIATIPGGAPAAISMPKPKSAVINMGIRQPGEAANATRSRVWMDRFTGKVLRVDNSRNPAPGHNGTTLRLTIAMLHTGVLFGWMTGALVLLGAVSQVVLVITGFMIWVKRTFRTPKARAVPVAALLALSLSSTSAAAQAPSDDAIRAVLKRRVDSGGVKGLVVGVIDRDGRQRVVSYGTSDATGLPLDANTVFEIGSLTKTFTATLFADMVLRGEVALDDPAQKYLPATVKMPSRNGRQITLVDLATHTSGLAKVPSNLKQTDPQNPYASYSVQEMYDYLSSYTLPRDPGERFEYSNTGMGLLGHILALRAGKSYEDLLTERVLVPLRMSSTRITLTPEMRAHFAQGHDKAGGKKQAWDLPTIAGAGALRSNMHDLLLYLAAQRDTTKGPLAKVIAMTHRRFHAGPNSNVSVGLAWHQLALPGGTVIYHSGETGGFHSYFGFNPATGTNAVMLANSTGQIDEIGLKLVDETQLMKEELVEPVIARGVLQSYVGKYEVRPGIIFAISMIGDRIGIGQVGKTPIPLFAENETTFYIKGPNAGLVFHKSLNGAVVGIDLRTGDEYEWGPRVP